MTGPAGSWAGGCRSFARGDRARQLRGLADSLREQLDGTCTPAQIHELVTADVRRAARLIDTGLRSFAPAPAPGPAPGTHSSAA